MRNLLLTAWFAGIGAVCATTVQAGGPLDVTPEVEPTQPMMPASEMQFSGGLGLKVGQLAFDQTDDSIEEDGISSLSLNGYARMDWNAWSVFADVNSLRRDIGEEDFDAYVPEGALSYGLHAGRTFGNLYAGAFVGGNRFQGSDATETNGYVSGTLYGLEAEYKLSEAGALFAQIGDAEMVGDEGDTAFDGRFYRLGASYQFGRFGVAVDYEKGKSKDIFEDEGDEGDYRSMGVEASYGFASNLTATLGYQTADYNANTEDRGSEETISLGLSIALGEPKGRHNLTTSYNPGLAAAWAENLD